MKPLLSCFRMFLRQITKDRMLYAVLAAPLLAACFFRFGIPKIEILLCGYFRAAEVLSDYYLLFDLFLAALTPYMLCFASSMVLLTEMDEHTAGYMAVTPVGKRGYIVSRLIFPAAISALASFFLLHFFSLTCWSALSAFLVCLLTALLGVAVSLLLVAFSHNWVEGMALAKLSGLLMLGLPAPFFLFSRAQYLLAPLPSFWIAKLCTGGTLLPVLLALLTSFFWIWVLYIRFADKLF
ncbi:MAG: ABC transporter permease [Clostridiaceae bacterium]|nr:ABC transporter permease [Clostridiaceae bacterium]